MVVADQEVRSNSFQSRTPDSIIRSARASSFSKLRIASIVARVAPSASPNLARPRPRFAHTELRAAQILESPRWLPEDVVCHFPFPDGWGGRPRYLVQCASGENWKGKKATPKVALWEKLIDFTTKPLRGIAMPFALLEDEFRREANDDLLALLLNRHRLGALPQSGPGSWPDAMLRRDLNSWTQPRAIALPLA
jgi:hypothetical protein